MFVEQLGRIEPQILSIEIQVEGEHAGGAVPIEQFQRVRPVHLETAGGLNRLGDAFTVPPVEVRVRVRARDAAAVGCDGPPVHHDVRNAQAV